MAFKFENLLVWQKALDFTTDIHELTKTFPKDELFILTSQIKRAADSVALNIAEGSTGQSDAEFKKYITYSVRSAIEVVACLHIAKRRKLIANDKFEKLYEESTILIKMLQALKKTLNK